MDTHLCHNLFLYSLNKNYGHVLTDVSYIVIPILYLRIKTIYYSFAGIFLIFLKIDHLIHHKI